LDQNNYHLSVYLGILRRRKRQILYTATGIFLFFAILSFVIPPTYRSTATILIEEQEVPRDIIQTTVTGYANQRLQIIQKSVLTRENLLQIAKKLDLYPKKIVPDSEKKLIGQMYKGIKVETVSAKVTDPNSGATIRATMAFTLSFDATVPEVAQKVANELAGLFLQENLRIRTQKAEHASGFLSDEEVKLSQYIADLEAKLASYKEKHTGRLPELMNLNMSLMERSQRELEDTERQIYSLEERKLQLQAQLAHIQPHTGNSPAGRYKELQTQYLSASSAYSPNHPDVVKLKREIQSLKREMGIIDERGAIESEYKKVSAELTIARKNYSHDHPDVVRLEKSIASLEEKLRNTEKMSQLGFTLKPDNPAYISIQTQLDTVELNLKAAKEQRERAKQKLADYESRIIETPRVEQEGLALRREYDNAVKKYREIKQNLMTAELAVQLEKGQKGERFSLLEPPKLPEEPEMPNRRAFLLLGIVLGFGGGVGYASIAEYMDRTIRGSRAIALVLKSPPLAVIPYMPGTDPYLSRT
jgi:polysaccharide biosynthesis transport protein